MNVSTHGTNWKLRYFSIWTGESLSLFGSAVTQFILIWWVTTTTKSASALTIATLAGLIPQAVFGPLGGVVADRWNRKAILMIADTISAACVALIMFLFAAGSIELWHVYGLMAIRSTMQAFQSPASLATTPFLVPETWLVRAGGLSQSVMGITSIAAAPLGAIVLTLVPLHWALLIDIVTAALAVGIVACFKIPQPPRDIKESASVVADMRIGLRTLRRAPGFPQLFGISALMIGILMPVFSLIPLYVVSEFHGAAAQAAIMESFGGIGMLAGSVLVVLIRLPNPLIVSIQVLFALASATILFMGLVPGSMFWLLVALWTLGAMMDSLAQGPAMSLIQRHIASDVQGRVISLFSTLIGIAGPVGLALIGSLSGILGIRAVLIGSGGLATIVCLLGLRSKKLMMIGTK